MATVERQALEECALWLCGDLSMLDRVGIHSNMLRWIRHIKLWVATVVLVALVPCAIANGQSLVWCQGADGHSAIEQVHKFGGALAEVAAAGEQLNDERRLDTNHAATPCNDFEIATVSATPQFQPLVSNAPPPDRLCWFVGVVVSALDAPVQFGVAAQVNGHRRHGISSQGLAHQRTIVLRV